MKKMLSILSIFGLSVTVGSATMMVISCVEKESEYGVPNLKEYMDSIKSGSGDFAVEELAKNNNILLEIRNQQEEFDKDKQNTEEYFNLDLGYQIVMNDQLAIMTALNLSDRTVVNFDASGQSWSIKSIDKNEKNELIMGTTNSLTEIMEQIKDQINQDIHTIPNYVKSGYQNFISRMLIVSEYISVNLK